MDTEFSGLHKDTTLISIGIESYYIQYQYYGVATKYTGTIFTELRDHTISDNSSFYVDKTIQETVDRLENGVFWQVFFWILWIALIGAVVYGFYYLDNRWLEDRDETI